MSTIGRTGIAAAVAAVIGVVAVAWAGTSPSSEPTPHHPIVLEMGHAGGPVPVATSVPAAAAAP